MTQEQITQRKNELLKMRAELEAQDGFEEALKQELEYYAEMRRSEHAKEIGGQLLEIDAMLKICEEFGA